MNRSRTFAAPTVIALLLAGCAAGPRMERVCVQTQQQIVYKTAFGLALPVMTETCARYEQRPVKRKM